MHDHILVYALNHMAGIFRYIIIIIIIIIIAEERNDGLREKQKHGVR